MACSLPFGRSSTLTLPLEQNKLLGHFVSSSADLANVRQATADALAAPLEYPLLEKAIVSGDHVTVAVDSGVPQSAEVVAAVVEQLLECGVSPELLTVLYADPKQAAISLAVKQRATVPAGGSTAKIHVEVHNPADRGKLSFLTNTKSGKPIYLNRAVADADFVIPIGAVRSRASWHYRGPYGGLYPKFSDADAQRRFRNPRLCDAWDETFLKSQEEVDSIGRQSGAQFTVQVVPGSGDGAAAIVAGETQAVRQRAEELCSKRHRHVTPRPAKIVVAGLTGAANQTWQDAATAMAAVIDAAEDGGAIALCTELAEPLSPALEMLARVGDDSDEAVEQLGRDRPSDIYPVLQIASALHRVRVYLLSRLESSIVEDLGLIPVSDPGDIGRLAARSGGCLVVGDAQFATVDLRGRETAALQRS